MKMNPWVMFIRFNVAGTIKKVLKRELPRVFFSAPWYVFTASRYRPNSYSSALKYYREIRNLSWSTLTVS